MSVLDGLGHLQNTLIIKDSNKEIMMNKKPAKLELVTIDDHAGLPRFWWLLMCVAMIAGASMSFALLVIGLCHTCN